MFLVTHAKVVPGIGLHHTQVSNVVGVTPTVSAGGFKADAMTWANENYGDGFINVSDAMQDTAGYTYVFVESEQDGITVLAVSHQPYPNMAPEPEEEDEWL